MALIFNLAEIHPTRVNVLSPTLTRIYYFAIVLFVHDTVFMVILLHSISLPIPIK